MDPLPEDQFKSYEEWEDFVVQHEKKHQYLKQRPGETGRVYENRVNKAALEAQAFNNESGSGWKKTIQKLYADMPRSEAMAKEGASLTVQAESRQAAEYIGRITTSTMLLATGVLQHGKDKGRLYRKGPKGRISAKCLVSGREAGVFLPSRRQMDKLPKTRPLCYYSGPLRGRDTLR